MVGGRTVVHWVLEQDVDRATFAFYGECAQPYATAHGLGANPQDLGSFGHGRTAYGRRTVLSHMGILDY